jgi:hypothetical protein
VVQHFADRGSSHRRKGAARLIIDMVVCVCVCVGGGGVLLV